MKKRALAVLLSGALGAGCSLVVALDGYTGGGSSGASPPDASVDGVTPPAPPPPPPGSSDAGADALATRRCDALKGKQTTVLCEDFDGPTPLAGWPVVKNASVDTSLFASPGASLLVATPALSAGSTSNATIERDLPIATRLRASWALYPDGPCGNGDLTSLSFDDGNGKYFIVQVLFGADGSLLIQEYGQPGASSAPEYSRELPASVKWKSGTWQRLALEIDFSTPSAKTANLYVDDALVLDRFAVIGGYGLGAISASHIFAGISYVGGPSSACRFHYDDLAVETF